MMLAFSQARAVAKGTPEHWLGEGWRGHIHRRKKPQAAPQKFDLGRRGRARGGQASSAEEQSQWTMAGRPGYLVQSQSTASCNALTSA